MYQKLKNWASKPFTPGITALVPYLAILGLSFVFWTCIDTDSYYMIAQGRQMLETMEIPRYNNFVFYENFRIVVQQYPYCVLEYLAYLIPNNLGLWALMASQALLLFHIIKKKLDTHTNDQWISFMAAILICLGSSVSYFYSLRPENLTLILLFLECWALDRYKETGRKKFLLALPVLMLAEINFHASMWPFHICVYMAYAVPAIWPKNMPFKNPVTAAHIRISKEFIVAGLSMLPVMLLNPYGIEMPLYAVKSMRVFKYVPIIEQQSTTFTSPFGILQVALIIVLVAMLCKGMLTSVTFYMSAGFLLLACVNYHCSMFIPIVMYYMIRDALIIYERRGPIKASDIMPNGIKILLWSIIAILALYDIADLIWLTPEKDGQPAIEAAALYIVENQEDGENIFNNLDVGPILDYYGVKGIHSDSRPELMLESINGEWDSWMEYSWFRYGLIPERELERYHSVQGYMDEHNIQFIIDTKQNPAFPYLHGWLADNPDWVLAEIDDPSEECVFVVWIRADRE